MTLATLDTPAVEDARDRLPDRGDVPEEAQEALEPPEGPLEGEDHPTGEDILKPSARDTLATVAEHHMVTDAEDVAAELDTSVETVEKAMRLHGIEEPEGNATEDVPEGTIRVPLYGEVNTDYLRDPVHADSRLIEQLAVRCQYGVRDIKDFLETERNRGRPSSKPRWTVRESDIKATLQDIGLMDPEPEERATAEGEDVRLGGASHDFSDTGGLTVSTSDFE
jgi:hypothetical protein